MSARDIQEFLERKGSALASYSAHDIDGVRRSSADIIARAAYDHGINPKVLLVLLQKEQSLIESPSPSARGLAWATGYGICDSCDPADPSLARYKGFATQVEKAAQRKIEYTLNPSAFTYRARTQSRVDGVPLTPQNRATAALYNYTPHIRGNFNFWKLWVRYFEKLFPDGTVVKASSSDTIWLIQAGKRRKFMSLSAFLSRYGPRSTLSIPDADLEKYEIGNPILFPQYSLLRSPRGAVFLVVDETKYGITSKEVFRKIGFHPDEVIPASDQDLATLETIGVITHQNDSPIGELIQDPRTGGVYYRVQHIKYPLLERAVLKTNFAHRPIRMARGTMLDELDTGSPVLFDEGALVTEPEASAVYMISNGAKRPFATSLVFESLGFDWNDVLPTTGHTLALLPLGEMIDLGTDVDTQLPPDLVLATPR